MTQYVDYGSIPQAVRDLVANKVKLLDQYILMQTGQYEYTALILNTSTREVTQIRVFRPSGSSKYDVAVTDGTWDWTVYNEYYCYSNVGLGSALDLPVMEGVTAHSSVILSVALMFAIIFKGALYPCLRRGKSKS